MWWKKLLSLFVVFLFTCLAGKGAQEAVKGVAAALTPPVTKKLNVFAVLSDNLNQHALDVSKVLKAEEGIDTFPQLGFQIHCTLYMTRYEEAKIDQVKAFVASLSQTIRPFPAKTTGLHATKDFWLFINLERDRNLQALSDTVVHALAPFRSPSQSVPEWLTSYPEKMEYFKEFGSPNVFSQFEPHLTLLSKSDAEKISRFLTKHQGEPTLGGPQAGTVIGIGIAEADGAGQMKDNLTIFPFPPANP